MSPRPGWPLVEVEWADARSDGGWTSREETAHRTASVVRSVGFLLRRDRARLTLVQSADDRGEVCDSLVIPAGCVRRIRRLR